MKDLIPSEKPQDELPFATPGQSPGPLQDVQSWQRDDSSQSMGLKSFTICGFRRPTFWLSVALAAALIGLGIAGSVAANGQSKLEKW